MSPAISCTTCGVEVPPDAPACTSCGTPVLGAATRIASRARDPSDPFDPEAEPPAGPPAPDLFATTPPDQEPGPPDPFATSPPGGPPAPDLLAQLQQVTMGDYTIEEELGRGGMASVFLATENRLERKVAIKVMAPALLHGPGMVERFRLEARTIASLSHPNIVPIYTVKEAGGLLFFVMKFVGGSSLDGEIAARGQLPFEMVSRLIAGVGRALEYAHGEGIIHRDVKPGNILLDRSGHPVVTDFGIAKVAQSGNLTSTGLALGTPTYMSPEQCRGAKLSGAADQYSLGVVAYEMLAGAVPFKADSQWAVMYKHLNTPPPPVTEARPDCPDLLMAVVHRMLSKEPSNRWTTLAEAADVLEGKLAPPEGLFASLEVATESDGAGSPVEDAQASAPQASASEEGVVPPSPTSSSAASATLDGPDLPPGVDSLPGTTTTSSDLPGTVDAGHAGDDAATVDEAPVGVEGLEAGGGLTSGRANVEPSEGRAVPAIAPKPSRRSWVAVAGGVGLAAAVGVGGWALSRPDLPPPTPAGQVEVGSTETTTETDVVEAVAELRTLPAMASMDVGATLDVQVEAVDGLGGAAAAPALTWSSSDPGVATVNAEGLVSATGAGSVIVSAAGSGLTAEVSITVLAPPPVDASAVASVWMSMDSAAVPVGQTVVVRTEGRDVGGAATGGIVQLTSTDPNIARIVGGSGSEYTVEGNAEGATILRAQLDGFESEIPIRVAPEEVAAVAVNPGTLTLDSGSSEAISATVSGVRSPDLDRNVTWTSADVAVARVDATGVVQGLAPGSTTITATSEGQTASATVNVILPALPAAVASLASALRLLDDDAGLALTLSFSPTNADQGPWCAVADFSHGSDDPQTAQLVQSFDPTSADVNLEVTGTLADLQLDPGDYRAGARLVTSSVALWPVSCETAGTGQPLQTASANICLAKRAFGGWLDRPGDCD